MDEPLLQPPTPVEATPIKNPYNPRFKLPRKELMVGTLSLVFLAVTLGLVVSLRNQPQNLSSKGAQLDLPLKLLVQVSKDPKTGLLSVDKVTGVRGYGPKTGSMNTNTVSSLMATVLTQEVSGKVVNSFPLTFADFYYTDNMATKGATPYDPRVKLDKPLAWVIVPYATGGVLKLTNPDKAQTYVVDSAMVSNAVLSPYASTSNITTYVPTLPTPTSTSNTTGTKSLLSCAGNGAYCDADHGYYCCTGYRCVNNGCAPNPTNTIAPVCTSGAKRCCNTSWNASSYQTCINGQWDSCDQRTCPNGCTNGSCNSNPPIIPTNTPLPPPTKTPTPKPSATIAPTTSLGCVSGNQICCVTSWGATGFKTCINGQWSNCDTNVCPNGCTNGACNSAPPIVPTNTLTPTPICKEGATKCCSTSWGASSYQACVNGVWDNCDQRVCANGCTYGACNFNPPIIPTYTLTPSLSPTSTNCTLKMGKFTLGSDQSLVPITNNAMVSFRIDGIDYSTTDSTHTFTAISKGQHILNMADSAMDPLYATRSVKICENNLNCFTGLGYLLPIAGTFYTPVCNSELNIDFIYTDPLPTPTPTPNGKLDILVLNSNFSSGGEFLSYVYKMGGDFIQTPPFNGYSNGKIVFKSVTAAKNLECQMVPVGSYQTVQCDYDAILREAIVSGVPYDSIMVIHKDANYGGSAFEGSNVLFVTSEAVATDTTISQHEFGHSYASLWDEYDYKIPYDGSPIGPNCDSSTVCPKWRGTLGTECIRVCGFSDLYRPTQCNIMAGCRNNPPSYDPVSLNVMRQALGRVIK